MVQVIQSIYVPTGVISMFAAPVIVLPAPPAGFINNILGISHDMTFVSAAYTTATKFKYGVSDGSDVYEESNCLPSVLNVNLPALKKNSSQSVFSTTKALYVTTDLLAAAGDSTINAYIIYEQVQIGA